MKVKLRIDKEKAVSGVLECDTPEKLYKHFQAAFLIADSPQKMLDGIDRLEIAMGILSKPRASALDMYAAQQECIYSGHDTKQVYNEIHPESPVPSISDEILPERLKVELVSLGGKALNKCGAEMENAASEHGNVLRINSLINSLIREKQNFIDSEVEKERQSDESINLQKKIEAIYKEMSKLNFPSGEYASMPNDKYHIMYSNIFKEKEVIDKEISKYNGTVAKRIENDAAQKFDESINALKLEREEALRRRKEADSALYLAVSKDILSSSPISEEQAAAWVEGNVFMSDAGIKALRRIGYDQGQFKKDVAEMYRYVGGKIGPIEFIVEGKSKRAFARGATTIAIQGNFTKRTLFHELAHLVEHLDPAFSTACKNFIAARAIGKPVSLKKLTRINYRPTEVAYPDNFIDPYVGKIYDTDSTEVVSMGLQNLSDQAALAELARRDPEHFKLVLGICKRNNPFTHMRIEQTFEATTEKINEHSRQEAWKNALGKVSGKDFEAKLTFVSQNAWGYKGYWIDLRVRSGILFSIQMDAGKTKSRSIAMGSVSELRSIAYLLIAHDEGLFFHDLPAGEDSQQKIVWLIKDKKVPDWFTETTKLPKV